MSNKNRKGTSVQASQNSNGIEARIEHIEESSPYPSGEFLQQLQQIDPNLVNRVMSMAEAEQKHRHQIQTVQHQEIVRVNTANIANDNKLLGLLSKGQWFGLLLSLGLVVLAVFAIYWHEPWVAGVAVMASVGILIVYVLRQQPKQQNLPPQ